ncbi:flavodoxin domain-containing protein [Isoptericola sp. b441]|uniref:Flavodoxin domain-containing protein n=1 Tax=Actinotalea lenta TaxID=3064654 RepID=A0ABT9DD76_9CELL|nr:MULTISPECIES: flavodoxin domain-containing protein [unclassified Isoptericola]MDO8108531.1 flavodoxin domain-containing protein [Isoptericola sp. b441]MDO8119941.1 flavodoxin domain-containing protein [Isoptericola sp. b490]
MRVMVAVASRHGATREIGEAIADVLRGAGFDVDVTDPDDVEDVEPFDAVVLGSAVYVGRWAAGARAFVDRFAGRLAQRPVWLFSSGPVGDPPAPMGDPEEIGPIMRRMGARGHKTFAGRLDRGGLALAERAVVALVQAEQGDFRAWPDVQDWASRIAEDLHSEEIRRLRHVR